MVLVVDSSASNDSSGILKRSEWSCCCSDYNLELKGYSCRRSTLGTDRSAKCIQRDDIGKIKIGRRPDLALFKIDDLRYSWCNDFIASLTLSGAKLANYIMMEGLWKVKNGMIIDYDIINLLKRHKDASRKLRGMIN